MSAQIWDVQFWLAIGAVLGAVFYLVRRGHRSRQGKAPMCGNCDQCGAQDQTRQWG